MKKLILYPLLGFLGLIVLTISVILGVLFFRPGLLLNPDNLRVVLEKTSVLKQWSWTKSEMKFDWQKWNDRHIHGYFADLCFLYESEGLDLQSCFEEVSWDFNLRFMDGEGLRADTNEPFTVRSKNTRVLTRETPKKKTESPPDIWGYWNMFWNPVVPEMDIKFSEISVTASGKEFHFDLEAQKLPRSFELKALGFKLLADPDELEILGPAKYRLPMGPVKGIPLHLRNFYLKALVKETGIPFELKGAVEVIDFLVSGKLHLPIEEGLESVAFRKEFLKTLEARLELKNLQENFKRYAPKGFSSLPAPLNVMEGSIVTEVKGLEGTEKNSVDFSSSTHIDLKSAKQVLDVKIGASAPVNVKDFSPGAVKIDIDFNRVTIQLPRLSKKSVPPQFAPDSRIKNAPFGPSTADKKEAKEPIDLTLDLQALNEKGLHLRTNLLDEELRLNFDLHIDGGNLEKGFVKILPLKTTVFKRPIHVQNLNIEFNFPYEPVLMGAIQFPLPEYKITLTLEGPISKPRYAFTSVPELPQSDIYAVLLFGRPLADLDSDDKTAAQKTNQILSQGILSLSVLYFLAGSPVEYVGYDPDSNNATAQIGLGSKSSLRVGAGSEGVNSTGVRRSLGKGWYLDTSVQSNTGLSENAGRNYGVMLERIIAY